MSNLTLEQAQVLICTANSTGGVMGKMIDAQSICVATAGTNQIGREADIFKAVIWHSVFLASIVGADDRAAGVRLPVHADGAALAARGCTPPARFTPGCHQTPLTRLFPKGRPRVARSEAERNPWSRRQ